MDGLCAPAQGWCLLHKSGIAVQRGGSTFADEPGPGSNMFEMQCDDTNVHSTQACALLLTASATFRNLKHSVEFLIEGFLNVSFKTSGASPEELLKKMWTCTWSSTLQFAEASGQVIFSKLLAETRITFSSTREKLEFKDCEYPKSDDSVTFQAKEMFWAKRPNEWWALIKTSLKNRECRGHVKMGVGNAM